MFDRLKVLFDSGIFVYLAIFFGAQLLIIAVFIHAYVNRKKELVMQFEAFYKQKYSSRLWGGGSLYAAQYFYYVILQRK